MIITLLLSSGEELVAELIRHDEVGIRVRRPLRVEPVEMGDRQVTRLNPFMSLEDGEETILYMRHVMATSKCAHKVVDYYTKVVDKMYNGGFTEIDADTSGRVTVEEILSLMSGRTKIQ